MMSTNLFNKNAGNIGRGKEMTLLLLTAAFLFTFYLPASPLFNNLAIFSLSVSCFLFNSWREKLQLLRQRPAILFIVAFYLIQVISMWLSDDRGKGLLFLQVRIPLLLFPISLGLIYLSDALKLRIYFFYALITTLAAVFCIICAGLTYYRTGDSGFIYNDSLSAAIDKQSVYFALMVNIAIFTYGYLLIKNYITPRFKKIVITAIAFLMIIHFLLASRMEIIFLYTTLVVFALYYSFVKTRNRGAGYIIIGALALGAIVCVQLFPKTINRFNELLYPQYNFKNDAAESHYNMKLTADQWNGLNIRLAIWNCASGVIIQHPFMGVDLGDKDQALLDAFKEKGFNFGLRTNKNMHSTYLDVMVGMGLTGLIIFMAGFVILPLLSCIRLKDLLGTLIMIDFILSFVTETYPDRSMGCVIFGFFVAFIISYQHVKKPEYSGPGTV